MNPTAQPPKNPATTGTLTRENVRPEFPVARPRYTVDKVDDSAWEIAVVVPGVKRENVAIALENDLLDISATRDRSLPEGWRPLAEARPRPDYRLQLELAVEVDADAISAKLENGVLTLRLPAAKAATPRLIAVA
ncbi:MAG: Hsp20/alpha crystallin family protein [Verrucomicrobiae bacterium]|nr:Hsp20/alpha crystallin family protein [Verrucomicrobiae bacterium]MCP5539887.1 Hsp20/alpha crystallin family protein [Akkermansiaceae bacterium]MCP5551813.1 Hsp20/alpha crystallin family protein [Akkermansiaceae bacterium]